MCPSLALYAQATWENEAQKLPWGLQREPGHWGRRPGICVLTQGEWTKRQTLKAEENRAIICVLKNTKAMHKA